MAESKYPQTFLKCAIASMGDRPIGLPVTAIEAGTGRLSQEEGWTRWNSTPIGEGGIPPKRDDFNALAYTLSQFLVWYQQGGLMNYSAEFDYEPGNEVLSNGTKYRCLIGNGPNTEKGILAPGGDKTVWKNLDAPSVLAGQITPFYGAKLGGSDGRRLIPWGETAADERYIICDGGSDGRGGNVPDLTDKFILASPIEQAGQTGGSLSATTDSKQISGTVGDTVLTIDQIPSHTHAGTADEAGSHTHSRGSISGQGSFWAMVWGGNPDHEATTGCFYEIGRSTISGRTGSNNKTIINYGFDLSRSGDGTTGAAGQHTHTITNQPIGGSKSHTHSLTGASHTHSVTVDRPPFYRLAYFVKVPE